MSALSKIISLGIVLLSITPRLKSLRFKNEVPKDDAGLTEETSTQVLLKEYETCQQHINTMVSHYWTLFSIFIPVSTASLVAVPYIMVSINRSEWIILILGMGMIIILFCLWLYFRRVNTMILIGYFRMREIEKSLGMFKNLYVHQLDHWEEKTLDNATIERISKLKEKHAGKIGRVAIGIAHWVIIVLWAGAILLAFIAPFVGIVNNST